ncbi:hypothetical protein BT69DRAFT_200482 [Atractiella rhizophila]|nr:hypothetical protein BT69DRAFT_200482 [Atractiella rhizophila]
MPSMIFFPLLLLLSSSDARPTRSPLSKRGNGSADAPPGTYANGTKVAFQPDPDFVARSPTTWKVRVGGSSEGHVFTPPTVNAKVGDLISFSFASKAHAVIQSSLDSPCVPLDGGFQSPVYSVDPSQDDLPREDRPRFLLPVNTTDPIYFFGSDHCADAGMVGIINPPSDSTFQQFQDAAKASSSSSPRIPRLKLTLDPIG